MKKRSLLAVILILGVVFLTRNNVAWADAVDADSPVAILAEGQPSLPQAGIPKGSIVPPPTTSGRICSPNDVPGVYPIGGVAVLYVDELDPGYCVQANIIIVQQQKKTGKLPEGGQAFLSKIALFRVYKQGLVDKVPLDDANMSLCFALPPDKEGEIYFYDYYGADFFGRKENPGWVVNGTVDNEGIVCTSAMATGAYVLIEHEQ